MINVNRREMSLGLSLSLGVAALLLAGTIPACDLDTTNGDLSYGKLRVCYEGTNFVNEVRHHSGIIESIEPADSQSDTFNSCSTTVTLKEGDDTLVFGYGVFDAEDKDISPELDLEIGDEVEVDLVSGSTWGFDRGVAIRDPDGLVAAFEEGYQGIEVSADEMNGLTVDIGERTGATLSDDCGIQEGLDLIFTGDFELTLESGEMGQLEIDGATLNVMNVATYEYTEINCTDIWGPKTFAVWR